MPGHLKNNVLPDFADLYDFCKTTLQLNLSIFSLLDFEGKCQCKFLNTTDDCFLKRHVSLSKNILLNNTQHPLKLKHFAQVKHLTFQAKYFSKKN